MNRFDFYRSGSRGSKSTKRIERVFGASVLAVVLLLGEASSRAGMVLTTQAEKAGFGLKTFATGFSHTGNASTGIGPLGIAFAPGGVVLVGTYPGDLYRLPDDSNGQVARNVVSNTGAASFTGMATVGGKVYENDRSLGYIFQIASNNNFATVSYPIVATPNSFSALNDLKADPANGTLMVSTSKGIFDVNPISGATHLINNHYVDGLAINSAGTVVYGADRNTADPEDGHVLGFNISNGAKVFDFAFPVSEGIDGLALGSGRLQGNIFVNTNSGDLWEVNLTTDAVTLIGFGGSRGDFVEVDPNDGSLLITQSDRILRLYAPTGGGFGSVPEPSTALLLSVGLGAILGYRLLIRGRSLSLNM